MSRADNRRTALMLAAVVVGMFGFGFALVPLYNVFCAITGLNGKPGVAEAASLDGQVDETRLIRVQFLGSVNSQLPWDVQPADAEMEVHPGAIYATSFRARNRSGQGMIAQAVPSVDPGVASLYLNKTECFCFRQQQFEAGETRDMPVRFVISRDLPADIRTVTVSYTFFKIETQGAEPSPGRASPENVRG